MALLMKRWLPELLDETDLAVVGSLQNVREWREGNMVSLIPLVEGEAQVL